MQVMLRGKNALAYTAGIVDGEGCISLVRRGNHQVVLDVHVINTNEWLIKWLHMQYGGHIAFSVPDNHKHKDRWDWHISAKKAMVFLELISPYLQMKHPQAELAILFQKDRVQYWGATKGHRGGSGKSPESYVVEEAQRVLMNKYNRKGKD